MTDPEGERSPEILNVKLIPYSDAILKSFEKVSFKFRGKTEL